MLPFLQDKITARKLLIYSEKDGEHPVNAAEISNSTGKTLDGGPVTVYDGGGYAGEALFETVKSEDKRLIGYAVDYGTRITTAFDSGKSAVREIHVVNGNLELHYGQRATRTYTIRNVDAKAKNLIIQQEGVSEHSVLSPKPVERTATAYRFQVSVPANGGQTLKVEEERDLYRFRGCHELGTRLSAQHRREQGVERRRTQATEGYRRAEIRSCRCAEFA